MIDDKVLNNALDILLSAGADYADLFAEKGRFFSSVSDDHRISTSFHDQEGVGIRAVKDYADYYITCKDLTEKNILNACRTLASGLKTADGQKSVQLVYGEKPDFYDPQEDPSEIEVNKKIELLKKLQDTVWNYSNLIKQATIRYSDYDRNILFVNSEDQKILNHRLALVEFLTFVYAGNGDERQLGWSGKSFYDGWENFKGENDPELLAKKACEQALLMLKAKDCPSGEMPVVFAPGSNGVLFHESCGHGMEADLVQKGSSFAGLIGKQVASDKVTIKDTGLIKGFPGSYAFDDEGTESQNTTLIEKGILKNYMNSRVTASQMGMELTGSGRRQSYRHPPVPRMRNTYIENGQDDPEEMVKSVNKGLYALDVGFGGQVDVVTGRFITSIILGYMIEDGKLTYPVKGASITGIGIDALKNIDMVGNDLELDPSPGRCGKGQEVPVGVGMPTLRIKNLLVGGKG